ncbi:MAG: hypothetical protein COU08_00745 [Candidatus Harrisonbacteria bacterium CG10_big_fil_rev_8_21_14_0_10_42_17]|uniref:Bacterial Ig-like domain-containing protein n=1 Tax=Candidatus Harrisonbacteria bacterium CG10_big_fil_rev_8_21_14_0_10_42_17 TaxID=1974584 RepID=A0A2M6WJ28_9BACT|nr:MAG: hypothetical protein COU08_00745 [Candidatus Harrisonbacteria bacterium CG10_big_fil_rev_8_21_14_0_10_42_17]
MTFVFIRNSIFLFFFVLMFSMPYFTVAQDVPTQTAEPPIKRILVQNITLDQPYISVSPNLFYPLDEVLYIEGRGVPGATVTLTLEKEKPDDQPLKFTAHVDSFGEWVVAERTFLSSGVWRVYARQELGDEVSERSNPRVVRSVVTGINIFGYQVKYVVLAGLFLLVFLLVMAIFFYFIRKIGKLKRGLFAHQLHETEDRVRENLSSIRKELMAELQELANNTQGKQLDSDEVQKRDRILRRLEDLERDVDRDIDSLEKKI